MPHAPPDARPATDRGSHPVTRRRSTWILFAAFAIAAVALLGFLGSSAGSGTQAPPAPTGGLHPDLSGVPASSPSSALAPELGLSTSITPKAICAFGLSSCPAATGYGRVTLTANAGGEGVLAWPAVQVAFVIETTVYDGVYDPTAGDYGSDPCAQGGAMPCEESNGVPFYVAHAQQIANAIQEANPHTQVSFAMVDFFGTGSDFNDVDGQEYHVDIANFIPAPYFGTAVQANFQDTVLAGGWTYPDSDFSDNMLHSSSITALYGTIVGSGLSWSNNTHHVIVLMGSTAPRDPNYLENYCVSASDYASYSSSCYNSGCEPSYQFPVGPSPNCEGWVQSQDGNQTHSIAELAKTAHQCTDSIGGVCTVDVIDLVDTATDPYSKGWPAGRAGGGPGGTLVVQNVNRVLLAGCDLAAATGGTWDGPSYFTCPNGQTGTLQYYPHGSAQQPNTNNPTLYNAFRLLGFGPIQQTQIAAGSGRPIFAYVPIGNIALPPASELQATASCLSNGVPMRGCQTSPSILTFGSLHYLAWNWSTNASENIMYIGDIWSASFNVMATGPPYAVVPVDACITVDCKAGGSDAVNGLYTWATYVPYSNNSIITQSFPLATVQVEFTAGVTTPPPAPPPPAVPPPGIGIAAPAAVPALTGLPVTQSVGVTSVSLQAAAAGFLAAGFLRVSLKNKPIAMRVAAKSSPMTSKFDSEQAMQARDRGIGRFE